MNRREFLRTAGLVGGAAAIGGPSILGFGNSSSAASRAPTPGGPHVPANSILNSPAAECPIDTHYRDVSGTNVRTTHIRKLGDEPNPFRGCMHNDPGHGWGASRKQRDNGFLGPGTGNDRFATGYYLGEDIPVQSSMARRFTVMDRHHSSV